MAWDNYYWVWKYHPYVLILGSTTRSKNKRNFRKFGYRYITKFIDKWYNECKNIIRQFQIKFIVIPKLCWTKLEGGREVSFDGMPVSVDKVSVRDCQYGDHYWKEKKETENKRSAWNCRIHTRLVAMHACMHMYVHVYVRTYTRRMYVRTYTRTYVHTNSHFNPIIIIGYLNFIST